MKYGNDSHGVRLLSEAIKVFRERALDRRLYTSPLLVPVWIYPEAMADAHDYAIISHNHFIRLRRAQGRERERLDSEARLSARWSRLWRRYASKCPTCSCGLRLTFGGGPYRLEGFVGPFCGNCLRGIGTKADQERAERRDQEQANETRAALERDLRAVPDDVIAAVFPPGVNRRDEVALRSLRGEALADVSEALRLLRRIFRKIAQMFALAKPLPEPEDQNDWYRASGDIECDACGELYYSHASDPREPWLTLVCGGKRVKL